MAVCSASSEDSVTAWAERLRLGDSKACDLLHRRYGMLLTSHIRRKYANALTAAADENDLAQSVFCALWKAATRGSLQLMASRESFWALLLGIAKHKAISRIRAARALKRGGAQKISEQVAIDQIPTPGSANAAPRSVAQLFVREQEMLFEVLADDSLRAIAVYKLEGFTHPEIAQKLGMGLRTVERKVATIRTMWIGYFETPEGGLPGHDSEVH